MRKLTLLHFLALLCVLVPAVTAAGSDASRTADGKPDLSGTYNAATLTPLERPAEFGDNLYLSKEEAQRLVTEEQALAAKALRPTDPDREAPPSGGAAIVGFEQIRAQGEALGAGNVGGYNWFWVDRGQEALSIDGKFRTSIIVDPPNGRMPPMTAAAKEHMELSVSQWTRNDGTAWWLDDPGPDPYDDPEYRPLAERCLIGFSVGPPQLPSLYNNYTRIVQTPDHVMILAEMVHDTRIVRMGSEHLPAEIRKWLGDSIGWWEGDTLVIDTTNFRDGTGYEGATRDLHVVERLSALPGGDVRYSFTVEDPNVWTAAWTGDYVWARSDNKIFEYACHEGNYAMGGIMRGARLLEAEHQAGEAP